MKTFNQFLTETSNKKTSMGEFEKLIHKFLPFVLKELKIKSVPPIRFETNKNKIGTDDIPEIIIVKSSNFSDSEATFGQTSYKNKIIINVENRHPLDALRTLAHELVHYKQHTKGVYGNGDTGSPTENEANVKSGIIMRNFDYANPEAFKMNPL